MSTPKLILAGALAAAMAACSSHPAPPPATSAATPAKSSTALPASNPLAPLLNTRNRARSVQQTLNARDAAERKALKDAQQ